MSEGFKEMVHGLGDSELSVIGLNEIDATFLRTYGPIVLTCNKTLVFDSHDNLLYRKTPAGDTELFHSVLMSGY